MFYVLLPRSEFQGYWISIPAVMGQQAEYTLYRSPVCHGAHDTIYLIVIGSSAVTEAGFTMSQ